MRNPPTNYPFHDRFHGIGRLGCLRRIFLHAAGDDPKRAVHKRPLVPPRSSEGSYSSSCQQMLPLRDAAARLVRRSRNCGRPPGKVHAERQARLGKEFLDLVQRLPSEVRRSQHFGFGLLHQLADVVDPVVLQTVRRSDSQFEFIHPFQHFAGLLRHKFDIRWRPLRRG